MASDIWPWQPFQNLPATPDREDGTRYFDYHHTENDTLDKIDPAEMAQNVAAYAVSRGWRRNPRWILGRGRG